MFKALLVVYVVSIGSGGNQGGSLTTTPFETMAQCKAAIKHAEDVIDDWHYGNDKTKIVPVEKTMKCFEIPPGPTQNMVQPPSETSESSPIIVDNPSPRTDKRWNDR
jgi:hypothetical protein